MENITLVAIKGQINSKTANYLQEQLRPIIQSNTHIILDMHDVDFISGLGMRILLTIDRLIKHQNNKIIFVKVITEVKDIMNVTGYINYFTLINDQDEAIKHLNELDKL